SGRISFLTIHADATALTLRLRLPLHLPLPLPLSLNHSRPHQRLSVIPGHKLPGRDTALRPVEYYVHPLIGLEYRTGFEGLTVSDACLVTGAVAGSEDAVGPDPVHIIFAHKQSSAIQT